MFSVHPSVQWIPLHFLATGLTWVCYWLCLAGVSTWLHGMADVCSLPFGLYEALAFHSVAESLGIISAAL